MKRLKVILPGLLGPFSSALPMHIHAQLSQADFKPLNTWLSRAQLSLTPADNYFYTLCAEIAPDYPSGLCRLSAEYDQLELSGGYLYRADPVHFKAESDHAILLGPEMLSPTMQESRQLIEAFNLHFQQDNIALHANSAERWYLQCEKPLELVFSALDYALGRDIKHFMPKGNDALWWRKTVNEAQMLFFQHEVNLQRESNGQLAINGLWLWDIQPEFVHPVQDTIQAENYQCFSDDMLVESLAKQSAINVKSQLSFSVEKQMRDNNILVSDALYPAVCYGDVDAWFESLKEFCQSTFVDICYCLQSRQVDEVLIYPCDGRVFKVNRKQLRKFWQGIKRLDQFIAVED